MKADTMPYGSLPQLSTPISRIVLGTSGIRSADRHPILDAYVEAGGNCLDTARVYGGGTAEVAVGEWIRRTRPEGLVLLVKGAHPPNCRPDAVAGELTESLDTLGVEHAGLYLLHRDDPAVPVGEFVDALDAEASAGRITAYGGSNWSQARLSAANRYAAAHGKRPMVAASNHFALARAVEPLYPGCEWETPESLTALAELGVALFPWSSQARGFFADVPPDSLDPNTWRCWGSPDNYARRDRARSLAGSLGVQAINVALAYVLNQAAPTFPIVGPQSVEELTVALAATDLSLSADQLRWLDTPTASAERSMA